MGHYGEKDVTFVDKPNGDVVGLKLQVADVWKPGGSFVIKANFVQNVEPAVAGVARQAR